MTKKILNKKAHRFCFVAANGKRIIYVLTFGDEVNICNGAAQEALKQHA
ncbi:MAG: hypothetical protein JKX92_06645 [Porticoccaceae bacterium]|nr:hypothetical protein [Porticoccaceae bacterium]